MKRIKFKIVIAIFQKCKVNGCFDVTNNEINKRLLKR